MNSKLHSITETDFEVLIELFREFAGFQKSSDKMVNTLDNMREEKDYIKGFAIKDEKGKILGYVTYSFIYYTWTGKSLYIDDLFVIPEYRGCGYGTLLLKEAIKFAENNKCHKIRWQVSNWNKPAIAFYKSMGASIDCIEQNCEIVF